MTLSPNIVLGNDYVTAYFADQIWPKTLKDHRKRWDDAAKTGFKTEKSKSAVTAGKVLLSMQTKGLSDTGEAEQNYTGQLEQIRQGVSEAILQEQVPPGYHEEIKKYFDTLKPAEGGETEPSEN